MRVILLTDIKGVGKKYDIKEVKDGYARNFLFPNGFAKRANDNTMKQLEFQKRLMQQKEEMELLEIQKKASQLDGMEVVIPMKVGEKGELFESISPQKISERLREMGYDVKKHEIKIDNPIKEIGEFVVLLEFDHGIEAKITVIVVEAKE